MLKEVGGLLIRTPQNKYKMHGLRYWDYMGSRLRERRIEEMQELDDKIHKLKESKFISRQLEFKF